MPGVVCTREGQKGSLDLNLCFLLARGLLDKGREEVPTELLNNIGVLHFERGEFELAERTFVEALGDGIWHTLIDGKAQPYPIDASASIHQYKDMQLFHRLEEEGFAVEVPWNKISILFNLARLFEQSHNIEMASILYRLILFKVCVFIPGYAFFMPHGEFELIMVQVFSLDPQPF
ncbi:hypothetical protein TEA_013328 [Camellia sinensis var. sinensis]|uniref:Uncharacterized protein n=1 Tax=Camellia sinensis var. sinensis TaxID=542762 RepID=A0A4S4EVC2_CAMSN|nr:hypothetical protein TEA_013328 [Camellia sinensis var. sinensis]